jgi:hypothetical protein
MQTFELIVPFKHNLFSEIENLLLVACVLAQAAY